MTSGEPVLIPAGTVFTPEDLTFYADRDSRSLDDAIAEFEQAGARVGQDVGDDRGAVSAQHRLW